MQGVVTPNIVAASRGLPLSGMSMRFSTMPATAFTALEKMRMEISLRPSASTTEGNMTTSLVPTYWETLPEAMVETITLGTPMGSARMAGVARLVPPEPPTEMMPSNFPSAKSCGTSFSAAAGHDVRGEGAVVLLGDDGQCPRPRRRATSAFETSGAKYGS